MRKKSKLAEVIEYVRKGCSLYLACVKAHLTTREFYQYMAEDVQAREDFQLALADYADQCTDEIRSLTVGLKSGEIDTSTAKLLIETSKWLAQKACPEPFQVGGGDGADEGKTTEIVVKFV